MFQSTTSQESSENEEVYLIDDEDNDEEPTEEEILNYMQFLGFEASDDKDLLKIVMQAMKKQLPIGWKRAFLKNSNKMCYFDTVTQNFHLYTQSDELAINELDNLKKSKQQILVGKNKSLPPLSEIKGKNKTKDQKKDIFKENKLNKGLKDNSENNDMSAINGSYQMERIGDQEGAFNSNSKNDLNYEKQTIITHSKEKDVNAFNKNSSNRNINKYSEMNNKIAKEEEIERNLRVSNENTEIKTIQKEKLPEKKLNSASQPENKHSNDDKLNNSVKHNSKVNETKKSEVRLHDENQMTQKQKTELLAEKKRYYDTKIKEIEKLENTEKIKYEMKLKDHKLRKTFLKQTYQTQCENELISKYYKIEREFNCVEVEQKLEIELESELTRYKEELLNTSMNNEEKQVNHFIEKLKDEIKFTKEKLDQSQIKEEVVDDIELDNNDLLETKQLLEEMFNIEKKNLEMKYNTCIDEIENQEDIIFNNEIVQLKNSHTKSRHGTDNLFKSHYIKILQDYEKALETEFTLKSQAIEIEFKGKLSSEMETFKNGLELEIEDHWRIMTDSNKELEREYIDDISKLRYELKIQSNERNIFLSSYFDEVIRIYDCFKIQIQEKIDDISLAVMERLSKVAGQKECEWEFEEFLLNLNDKHNIECRKKKNNYELTENDYKIKSVLLEYFLDIGNELLSLEVNTRDRQQHQDDFYDNTIKIVKTKQHKYNQKLVNWRDNQLFDFMDITHKRIINSNSLSGLKVRNTIQSQKINKDVNCNEILYCSGINKKTDNKRYQEISQIIDVNMSQNNLLLSSADKLINNLVSSNDFISKLNNKLKNKIDKIKNFIEEEKTVFERDEFEITDEKNLHEKFKDALRKSNSKTTSNSTYFSNNKTKISMSIMNEYHDKILRISGKLERKKDIYNRIVESFNEFLNFVQLNVNDLKDNSIQNTVNQKLDQLLSYTEEYKRSFYENYQLEYLSQEQENNYIPTKESDIAYLGNNLKTSSVLQNKYPNENHSFTKKQNSLNNSFNNFVHFYGRNSLHRDLKTPSSSQYFNFHKNKSNLNHRGEYLNISFN